MKTSETDNVWTRIENIEPDCFACGIHNKHGLNMKFETNGEKVRSCIKVPSRLRGWSNLVHGGIISTLIDETISWTAIHLIKKCILTKNIKIDFKKPLTINTPVIVYGYIVEQKNKRAVTMGADIFGENDKIYASGRGELALFTPEDFSKLGVIDDEQLERMAEAWDWFRI